jgi:hypothetical protein
MMTNKIFNRLMIVGFSVIIFGFSALTLFSKHGELSFYENRYLAKPVSLTWDSYLSGEFVSGNEDAFSDNIFMRDNMLKLYTVVNRSCLGKNEVNKVVFGEDILLPYYSSNYYDEAAVNSDISTMTDSLTKLNSLVNEQGGRFVFAAVPAQFSLYRDKFPKYSCTFAPKLDYERSSFINGTLKAAGVPVIDLKTVFEARADRDKLYYKTDHHYNCNGAFVAYQSILQNLNEQTGYDLKILTEDDLEYKTFPNRFLGSSARKIYDIYDNDDRLEICYPKKQIPFKRYDNGEEVEATVFSLPNEGDYADYEAFMGGDKAETLIDTNRPELPTALIFGDSYTNAVESLLYYSFDKTYSIDLRYYREMSLADYIKEKKPDVVIYVRDDTIYLSSENNGCFFEIPQ